MAVLAQGDKGDISENIVEKYDMIILTEEKIQNTCTITHRCLEFCLYVLYMCKCAALWLAVRDPIWVCVRAGMWCCRCAEVRQCRFVVLAYLRSGRMRGRPFQNVSIYRWVKTPI